jgi:hypothetical protein
VEVHSLLNLHSSSSFYTPVSWGTLLHGALAFVSKALTALALKYPFKDVCMVNSLEIEIMSFPGAQNRFVYYLI